MNGDVADASLATGGSSLYMSVCPFDGSLTMTSPPTQLPPLHLLRTADWVHVSSRHTRHPKQCSVFHLGWYWPKISQHAMFNPALTAVRFGSPGCRTTCLNLSHGSLALGAECLKRHSLPFVRAVSVAAPFTLTRWSRSSTCEDQLHPRYASQVIIVILHTQDTSSQSSVNLCISPKKRREK